METVLLYNLSEKDYGKAIIRILEQFGIRIIEVEDKDVGQKVGYLVHEAGYLPNNDKAEPFDEEMMVFHDFEEGQVDIVMQVLQMADIPYITLKARTTEKNLDFTFRTLYEKVKEEYEKEYC